MLTAAFSTAIMFGLKMWWYNIALINNYLPFFIIVVKDECEIMLDVNLSADLGLQLYLRFGHLYNFDITILLTDLGSDISAE